MEQKFAAQLFTVRNELAKGIAPTFREIKKMGWAGVQISALPADHDPQEVADALRETGLRTAGMHISLDRLENDLENVLKEADLYGTKDIICPFLPKEYWNVEGYKKLKHSLNATAKKASDYRISYHNHAFEFETEIDGVSALEYILEPTEENLILAEIDVYWVKKGGRDPLSFIQPYVNRMPIIHLKDMSNDEAETFAEVGSGKIDFVPILQWGEKSGVEWYAVEQDVCPGNPMDSLQISLENLMKLKEVVFI
ncbi:sugar phosphate isomerase/epimerase family protein [Lederbergia citrea]|uniref:Sugar phosphate isomerase/epimerase n=1 Tax=Lederbergia citrea TaxID=2833581 RepID=A0A942Z6G0_9BACI|nr:sugar phosphate isomerase/epimerase [Lederbergia citrea]MBS4178987.1 sugar phosphate isomerase/epimerase [Lederbergia citrea]MBS4205667.1 sugar phosphate isomerase/epimerase [Lederbergia citrea]MBS4223996.1 sugar phosphate isomerase/epimerase [Lederbergia citrea]